MRTFLWTTLIIGICLGVTTGASADPLLLDEPFDYTAGTLLTANGWINHSGTSNFIPVTASGLTYPGYPSSGIGNAASMLSTGEDVHRFFTAQTSGSVYYAFLVNISAASATADYFTHLGANPWSTSFYGRVFCRSTTGGVNFGVTRSAASTSAVWAPGVYALNTTHLVVIKYTFVAGTTNDTVDLWVNPVSCPGEPAPLATSGVEPGGDPSSLAGVALRQGSTTPTLWIDGLLIGTVWADVVCGAPPTGACCASDGSCTVHTQADCATLGGAYSGDGTSCTPNPCPQLGTCCAPGGACTFVLQANCAGAWTQGGSCVPNPCTQPIGSCCAPDGSCTLTTQANCTGTWTEGGVCDPNTCAQPAGSCCYPDGTCAVTLAVDCTGIWTMFGVCVPNTCAQPTGACCAPTGFCTLGTAVDCATAGGVYQGNFTTCTPNPCPAPVRTLCEVAEDDLNGVAVLIGQRVTVQGIALCDGMNWSTTIREFQITDGACCIDIFGGSLTPTVALGDLVQVVGTVSNFNGKTEISTPDLSVTILSSGNPVPAPGVTTTGVLSSAGEPFESCLFTIRCVSIISGTWPAAGADANITIDDGTGPVTMRIDKDTDIDGSTAPVGPFTITGVGDQFDTSAPYTTGWQIKPRSLADFTYDCGPGSCCYPDGTCEVLLHSACTGTWTADGTCDPNPCGPSAVEVGEPDAVLGVRTTPNPFSGRVALRIAGPNLTAAQVLVFNSSGRRVRTVWSGLLNGHAIQLTWDGLDDSGREAATGIYMIRLESASGTAIGRIVKLR